MTRYPPFPKGTRQESGSNRGRPYQGDARPIEPWQLQPSGTARAWKRVANR